jgi:GNAT superfamily N-acetyltransferase
VPSHRRLRGRVAVNVERPALRPGRDDDARGFIALIAACWAEYPGCVMDRDEVPELDALARHAAGRGGAVWAAEAAGRLVGMVCVWPHADGAWELAKLYVAQPWRGSGLAHDLAATAEDYARAHGAERMLLWSDTRFDRAHRFYESRSYVRAGPLRVLGDRSNSIEFGYAKPLGDDVVQVLDGAGAASAEVPLARVLVACVDAGASVSFLAPLAPERARAFWRETARAVARGERVLLVAWHGGTLVGTVQLVFASAENQPHRADLAKLLVHPAFRRRGIGAALLAAAERTACAAGRTLLVLDTQSGGAGERLYRRAGWHAVGRVPDYARFADGAPCDTTFFFKSIGEAVQPSARHGATRHGAEVQP